MGQRNEAVLKAIIRKENEEWEIQLIADTDTKAVVLGRMMRENSADGRENVPILILWEEESSEIHDGQVNSVSFVISEGPDSDEFDAAKNGLALLNLEGLFKRK